jgi:hypothetical protein
MPSPWWRNEVESIRRRRTLRFVWWRLWVRNLAWDYVVSAFIGVVVSMGVESMLTRRLELSRARRARRGDGCACGAPAFNESTRQRYSRELGYYASPARRRLQHSSQDQERSCRERLAAIVCASDFTAAASAGTTSSTGDFHRARFFKC